MIWSDHLLKKYLFRTPHVTLLFLQIRSKSSFFLVIKLQRRSTAVLNWCISIMWSMIYWIWVYVPQLIWCETMLLPNDVSMKSPKRLRFRVKIYYLADTEISCIQIYLPKVAFSEFRVKCFNVSDVVNIYCSSMYNL